MLGIVGETERMEGTVISDGVNLADRLEELTRVYDAATVVSEQTLRRLADPAAYRTRFLGRVRVKGKREEVAILEILDGAPEEVIQSKLTSKANLEASLWLYHEGRHAEATVRFQQALQQYPADAAARLYLRRATQSMAQAAEPEWTGEESVL
jgi:hypothetical protein